MIRDFMVPGRAAILWAVVFFAGFQVGLAVAIAVWFPGLGDPNFAYKAERLRHYFQSKKSIGAATDRERSLRVIALGSSRTLFGLNAAGLGNDLTAAMGRPVAVFNFGVIGAGPITELLYLRKLLREGIVPDMVLIEVLPAFLAGQVQPPAEARWFLPNTHLPASDQTFLARYGFPTSELRRTDRRWWVLPWYVHRRALLSGLGPSWLPYGLRLNAVDATDAAGWVPDSPDLPAGRLVRGTICQHFAACFEGFQLEGKPAAALVELLGTCRQFNIRAVLVLMPETELFRGWYPDGMERQLEAFLERLGASSIDARLWVPDANFFDDNHLHSSGAAILRCKLARALPPLLAKPALPGSPQSSR